MQSFHSVSTLMPSVLMERVRRPLLLARVARTSDIGRSLSTTVRSFMRGGSRICNYDPQLASRIDNTNKIKRRRGNEGEKGHTSGSGQSGSLNLSTSAGRITSIPTSCATLTLLPTLVTQVIPSESTACPCFFVKLFHDRLFRFC